MVTCEVRDDVFLPADFSYLLFFDTEAVDMIHYLEMALKECILNPTINKTKPPTVMNQPIIK
jgi:hypothetical protein